MVWNECHCRAPVCAIRICMRVRMRMWDCDCICAQTDELNSSKWVTVQCTNNDMLYFTNRMRILGQVGFNDKNVGQWFVCMQPSSFSSLYIVRVGSVHDVFHSSESISVHILCLIQFDLIWSSLFISINFNLYSSVIVIINDKILIR